MGLEFVSKIMCYEGYKLCTFLLLVISSLFGLDIIFSILFSNPLSLCFYFNVSQVFTPIQNSI
jgi:hypothetical protein